MLQALQSMLAANGGHDPYLRVFNDLVSLMPWWYPYFWLGILGALVAYRFGSWLHRRLLTRHGIRRVHDRLARADAVAERDIRAWKLRRMAANDNALVSHDNESTAG